MSDGPNILVFDIETAPTTAWVWSLWKQNIGINQIRDDAYVLMWCAKWLGSDEVMHDALPRHKEHYAADRQDDSMIIESLSALLDKADACVTHNGDGFDLPWVISRLVYHEMPPIALPLSIDTLQMARTSMRFTSNKLDYLAQHLGLGAKLDTGGFELWEGCMAGDITSWRKMIEYCERDVVLTEEVYLRLRPHAKRHINLSLFHEDGLPRCGRCQSTALVKKGFYYTSVSKFQRYGCIGCGNRNIRGRFNLLDKSVRRALLTNAG